MLVTRVARCGQIRHSIVLLDLGRSDALEQFLVGGVLTHWVRAQMASSSFLARVARHRVNLVGWDHFLESCRL